MDAAGYQRILDELVGWAEEDPRVIGLVAVGSTARRDRQPDRWSDHDLIVVAAPGRSDAVRRDPSWIPDLGDVALRFTEPEHGLTIVYGTGHLIEFAVCDETDLGWLATDQHAVLVGPDGLAHALDTVVGRAQRQLATSDPDGTARAHRFVKELLIGTSRLRRGEVLSAHQHLAGAALPLLIDLVVSFIPGAPDAATDPLDPARRFESAHPDLAGRLHAALEAGLQDLRSELVAIARDHLAERIPSPGPGLALLC